MTSSEEPAGANGSTHASSAALVSLKLAKISVELRARAFASGAVEQDAELAVMLRATSEAA